MVYKSESLIKRLEKLREYRHDLREMEGLSFEEYIKDRKAKYSTERLLFLIAENILDFLDHILSSRFEVISDSYEDVIENSYKRQVIEDDLYMKLKGLGSFRNILAHEYLSLSDDEVFRNFRKMAEIIDQVIDSLERIIKI